MTRTPSISAVVPVYNSEQSLRELVTRLKEVMPSLTRQLEIVLVNDGSRDRSWEVITELAQAHSEVRGINLMRNYGQHNALLAGIRAATGELIVTIDDDLQNPPEEIGTMLGALGSGYDVVYGYPEREQHGLLRDLASQITKVVLQSAMGLENARHVSAFRLFRTTLRLAFDDFRSPRLSIDALLTWGTTRFAAVPVRHDPRRVGASNYTFRKLLVHALNMVTGFTVLPLQFASLIGFVFTLLGFGALLYVVGRYFIDGSAVPGFPFLASLISIFGGAQLFALGIIGEYLARVHFRLMDRPTYAIREAVGTLES